MAPISPTFDALRSPALSRGLVDSNDVFLLDNDAEVFVWCGRGASPAERRAGLAKGSEYISTSGRPANTRLTKVMEGAETSSFKANFASWTVVSDSSKRSASSIGGGGGGGGSPSPPNSPRKKAVSELMADMADGTARALQRRDTQLELARRMTDAAADGNTLVWRIENFKEVAVPKERHGHFYSGDSYIVCHTYMPCAYAPRCPKEPFPPKTPCRPHATSLPLPIPRADPMRAPAWQIPRRGAQGAHAALFLARRLVDSRREGRGGAHHDAHG